MNDTDIYKLICTILYKIGNRVHDSKGKAILSNLRNSIGKDISQVPLIWPIFFENLPEDYMKTNKFEIEEKIILTVMQLYSIYQQSEDNSLFSSEGIEFCEALRRIRSIDNSEALDRRFNVMITATTYDEILHHLRQMLKLLKSKSKIKEKINFARLGQDLYKIVKFNDKKTMIKWGKQYYYFVNKEEGDVQNDK